jgi:hypothetical protein
VNLDVAPLERSSSHIAAVGLDLACVSHARLTEIIDVDPIVGLDTIDSSLTE